MLLLPLLPEVVIAGRNSGFGRSHSYRHLDSNFSRAANDPTQFFFRGPNRFGDKFGDTVSLKAGIVKCWVFLRQQEWFICPSRLVNIADVRPGEHIIISFTAESEPSAVTREAMPRFALVAVDI